jgi:hypothetical protein
MSPRVDHGELGGIQVVIKNGEHGNPHVHAWYQGQTVEVYIGTLGVEKGGLPGKQMKQLKEWLAENEDRLFDKWAEITGLRARR